MGSTAFFEESISFTRKVPTLLELCVRTAIDNVRYLGDVGETDIELLKDILPHCTVDQLMHIEKSTQGRDLSPATNKLWRKFFEKQFGTEKANEIVREMKRRKVLVTWRKLYEKMLKDADEKQKMSVDKFKQRYEKESVKKQSRQIQICSKVPPSSNKRSFFGGSGSYSSISGAKGSLMKKAKMEYLNSPEVKMHAAMKMKNLQRSRSVPNLVKPNGFGSASSSKSTKPFGRP